MTMKIEFTEIKTDGRAVELIAQIIFPLSEFEKAGDNTYERRRIFDKITEKITDQIASEYLEAKRSELLAAVDMDQVTKGIQFKVINEFAKPGNVGGMQ